MEKKANSLFIQRVTPYYYHHLNMGAKMMEKGGWLRPMHFSSPEEEVINTRTNVGLIDAHSMGKFEIRGKQAKDFMQFTMTNNLNKLIPGTGAIYTCLCNQQGGIVDDVVVYYINDQYFYLITNTLSGPRVEKWFEKVLTEYTFDVYIINSTNKIAYLAVQGPKSPHIIQTLFNENILKLKYFQFTSVDLGNVPILLARTGYTGEIGYEFNFPSEFGHGMWAQMLEIGKKYGLQPIGGTAVQILRTEKAYRSHGTDMTTETNPFEVGLEWTIDFKKENFIGKNSLTQILHTGVKKRLVGFEVHHSEAIKEDKEILTENGALAGWITTSYRSPTIQKTIALGFLNENSWTEKKFITSKNRIKITVTNTPFYDPKNEKVRQSLHNKTAS